MLIYYPSCTFRKLLPDTAKTVINYLQRDMTIAGCCRASHIAFGEKDRAVVICGSCRSTLKDRADVISLWEYLLSKEDFLWPDYNGLEVNVQDCWRNRNQPEVHNDVRKILERMNIEVVPISESFSDADFCGTLHYAVKDKELQKRILAYGAKPLYELPKELQIEAMCDRAKAYNREMIVCDCACCLQGVQVSSAKGVHLLELIFQTVK